MTSPRLNRAIITNEYMLFVGAGASAPLGLQPTAPFLKLLPKKVDELIEQGYGTKFGEEKVAKFLSDLFTQAAKHFGAALPDSEIVLDYLDFMVKVCRELHSFPKEFTQLVGIGRDDFHSRWAELLSKLQGYIKKVVVEHYSKVDGEHALKIYKPLLESSCKQGNVLPIFTTNYDWAFEHLAEAGEAHLYLEDGFQRSPTGERWSKDVFSRFHPRQRKINIALFKLHGSTSWYRDTGASAYIRKFPNPAPELAGSRAVLIYPTQVKAQAIQEEPFKTAYDYLRETTTRTKLAIIIGFSFRDPAINDIFRNATAENRNLKLVVVEPNMSEKNVIALNDLLNKLGIQEQKSKKRLRVINGEFGDDPFVCEEIAKTVQGLDQWDKLESWVKKPPLKPAAGFR
jgi:hypothetical protein